MARLERCEASLLHSDGVKLLPVDMTGYTRSGRLQENADIAAR
jgi:hypothetical protein